MKLLLDTCTFLWIVTDSKELSARARDLFTEPGNDVYLSATSVWEIVVKHGLGRLTLSRPPWDIIPDHRERHHILSLPLDDESVFHLPKLPQLHRDPFDRMLICQAIANGLTLLTPDPEIRQYPVRVEW